MSLISRKNQITIPVGSLRAAGLRPGDDVEVRVSGVGRLEVVRTDDPVTEFAGIFGADVYPPEYLEELRREWP
jgi:bifunctional DNA-binding transcriptional regulator/antitoxin component of YhaV-PrlF toxin-antitoxin module